MGECFSISSPHPANPSLTTDNLMEVVRKVGHSWKNLGCKLGVRASKIGEIQDINLTDHERMEAMINDYVRHYPTPSWEKVAMALRKMRLYKLADVVTANYVKGTVDVACLIHYSWFSLLPRPPLSFVSPLTGIR